MNPKAVPGINHESNDRVRGSRCLDQESRPLLSSEEAGRVSRACELLSHPVRLQLLDVLARNEGRVCVCDLEAAVPVKQPTVSHHLKLLREAGLVESQRQGLWVYYYLNRAALAALRLEVESFLDVLGWSDRGVA